MTKRYMSILLAGMIVMAAKKPEEQLDPGPRPSDAVFQQAATAAILAGFFDPGSAQVQFDRGLVGGWFKPVLERKYAGWWTCGAVNGKNRLGGYVGFRRFVAVMYDDRIVFSGVGSGGSYDFLSMQCEQAIAKGILPTASAAAASANPVVPIDPEAPRFGFGFMPVPDGAYIGAVEPGGAAAEAKLTKGMVITAINGIPIAGFNMGTIAKIVHSATGPTVFAIVGRGDVTLTKVLPK